MQLDKNVKLKELRDQITDHISFYFKLLDFCKKKH